MTPRKTRLAEGEALHRGRSARKHSIVVKKADCFSNGGPAAESRPVRLAKERPAESASCLVEGFMKREICQPPICAAAVVVKLYLLLQFLYRNFISLA